MSPLKLFYMPSAGSLAVHIVLRWVHARHESFRVSRADLGTSAFGASSTVPLLVDGDLQLTEPVAILGYLAELHPERALFGDGTPRSRAEVMRWLTLLHFELREALRHIEQPDGLPVDDIDMTRREATTSAWVRSLLEEFDAQLLNREWLTGTRTIADAYLFVMLQWAANEGMRLQGMERLSRFFRRMSADPDVHAALAVDAEARPNGLASARRPFPALDLSLAATTMHLLAEVTGAVGYREGDGALLEVRRGLVDVDLSTTGVVVSWDDENYRGRAALPIADLYRYADDGAILLVGGFGPSSRSPSARRAS